MNRKLLMLVAVFYFCSQSWASAANKEPAVIALFGDSITVGYNGGFTPDSGNGRTNFGYPSIYLAQILNGTRRPSIVANWGESGSPSGPSQRPGLIAYTNGLERILNDLATTKNIYVGSSYYVLILYGTNDFNWGISPSITGFNTRLMIQRARARGFTPVVATLLPRNDRDIRSYNTQIATAAFVEGAAMVDHYSAFLAAGGSSLLDDGLHPSNDGYLAIAQTWFDRYLKNAIEPDNIVITPIINLLLDEDE